MLQSVAEYYKVFLAHLLGPIIKLVIVVTILIIDYRSLSGPQCITFAKSNTILLGLTQRAVTLLYVVDAKNSNIKVP